MASTHLSLHYHVVFSTKDRMPMIHESWRARLHEYLGGTIRGLGGIPEAVGGVADHVHVLLGLKATHCLADFVREMKKAGTAWVHQEIPDAGKFTWQSGYGAFTVSAGSCDAVKDYIARQEEHHRVRSFREEYMLMLEKSGVTYDPKYMD
jgi:putative transposase